MSAEQKLDNSLSVSNVATKQKKLSKQIHQLEDNPLEPEWSEVIDLINSINLKKNIEAIIDEQLYENSSEEEVIRSACTLVYQSDILSLKQAAKNAFLATNDGIRLGHVLCQIYDNWIRAVCNVGWALVCKDSTSTYKSLVPSMIAVGGYGRGLMSPYSDLDLLLLVEANNDSISKLAEFVFYTLWDCGLKIGHAVRTIPECITDARKDHTILTTLLETRIVWGDQQRHSRLRYRLKQFLSKDDKREYIAAKLEEREIRLENASLARYLREPNVKDGTGAQRDLQMIRWFAISLGDGNTGVRNLVDTGVLEPEDYKVYQKCDKFLRTIRSHLHYLNNNSRNTLTFENQNDIAKILGYSQRKSLLPVERFMRHYYSTVRQVGELVRIVCASLERQNKKQAPFLIRLIQLKSTQTSKEVSKCIILSGNRPHIADAGIIDTDPLVIMRLFEYAALIDSDIHPDSCKYIRRNRKWRNSLIKQKEAYDTLIKILLTHHSEPGVLRQMNETGVIGALIPEFRKIEALVPFSRYHFYAVDEHLIRSVEALVELEKGSLISDSTIEGIFLDLPHRKSLYIATLLHDFAKGGEEPHEIAGARLIENIGSRIGLSDEETKLASWLVRYHLVLSETAQQKDIYDPRTISAFADLVASHDRLILLFALTLCDVYSVGPGTLTAWKITLFRDLYLACSRHLKQTEKTIRPQIVPPNEIQEKTKTLLNDIEKQYFDKFAEVQTKNYWTLANTESIARQCRCWLAHHGLNTNTEPSNFTAFPTVFPKHGIDDTGHTEQIYLAADHPKFALALAYGCTVNDASILSANLNTTSDGDGMHTIIWQQKFDDIESEQRLAKRIAEDTEKIIRGEIKLNQTLDKISSIKDKLIAPFTIDNKVSYDLAASERAAIVKIKSADAPGLLYFVTLELYNANMNILSANISTYGEKAVDTFYLCDYTNRKPTKTALIDLKKAILTGLEHFHSKRKSEN